MWVCMLGIKLMSAEEDGEEVPDKRLRVSNQRPAWGVRGLREGARRCGLGPVVRCNERGARRVGNGASRGGGGSGRWGQTGVATVAHVVVQGGPGP